MVASGQMATLDSPGSIIMKWSVPTLQLSKLKQLKFFFQWLAPVGNIFGVWIKGYVKQHQPSPENRQIYSCHDPSALVFL